MENGERVERKRVHTITWEDPRKVVEKGGSMSGLELLQKIRSGEIPPPPAARLVGYRVSEVEEGHTVFELKPAEYHYNPFGTVHGGILSTLLDTTMTAAVMTTLSTGTACSTLEIKVNFIRPMTERTGRVRCEARTIHVGGRIATAEAKVLDSQDNLYAHAVSTLMIFSTQRSA